MLPLALLAGGLATRMRPLTQMVPKALLDIAGEPFVVRQLRYLQAQGIQNVVLCTGYLGEQIEAVVGNGSALGLTVRYSPDGPKLLGTGGALRQALPLLGNSFFVMYGDSFLPIQFAPVQAAFDAACASQGKQALMTVLHNQGRWDGSNVLWADGHLARYSKRQPTVQMQHIDYGLGLVQAKVLQNYPQEQAFDLAEVYETLSDQGQLQGFEVQERFYEIGSPPGLSDTIAYFKKAGASTDSHSR